MSETEGLWYVQWLRPDGWWNLQGEDGPLTYEVKEAAERQMAKQLEHYPHSSYRVSQTPGIDEEEDD